MIVDATWYKAMAVAMADSQLLISQWLPQEWTKQKKQWMDVIGKGVMELY